jgi:hypothetical protein
MQPSTVPRPRQGGKICADVSYAIQVRACRLAHRCDARDEARTAALFDCCEARLPVIDGPFARERRDFEEPHHQNVGRLAFVARVERLDLAIGKAQRLARGFQHVVGLLRVALEPSIETAFRPACELPSKTRHPRQSTRRASGRVYSSGPKACFRAAPRCSPISPENLDL